MLKINTASKICGLLAAVLMLLTAASAAQAMSVTLYAGAFDKTMPGGEVVTMWGYGLQAGQYQSPGPIIEVPPGDTTLSITLINNLPEDTSIIIPGLVATGMAPIKQNINGKLRATSLDRVAAAGGGSQVYTFENVRPGTYLYTTGTHIGLQGALGLYGGVKTDFADHMVYDGVSYDNEALILYSEVDPALNQAVAGGTYGSAAYPSTIKFKPRYFLVNGEPYEQGVTSALRGGAPGDRLLVRFLSACLDMRTPSMIGRHFEIVGRDAYKLSTPLRQVALQLSPQRSLDTIIELPAVLSRVVIYDRSLKLTNSSQAGVGGLFSYLSACPADANGDGVVNRADLFVVSDEYRRNDCSLANPCYGDVNFDGVVNRTDIILISRDYRAECAIAP